MKMKNEKEIKSRMQMLKNKSNKRMGSDMPNETYSIRITPPTTKLKREFAVIIAETLSRLPKKIREKVLDEVSFELESSRKFGSLEPNLIIFEGRKEPVPTVFLPISSLAKRSDSYKMKVVAGLIARFILKRRPRKRAISFKESEKLAKERERKVVALCKKWGVGRLPKRG